MRYALAILALVISVAAAAPAALAQTVDQFGNAVVPLQYPGGNGGGAVYVDGVARSIVQPAPVYLGSGADSGVFAGPGAPGQGVVPFYPGDTQR
jgi:hypothetical protein